MRDIEQIPQLPVRTEKHWQQYLIDSLLAVGGALAVTGIIYAYHLYPTIPNISIVYLLVILLLATTRGRYAALVAAVVAFLSFDFFLVPPFYSFTISHWEDWIALFVFLATALVTSQLATTTRQSVEQARLREREARILYEAGRVINSTDRLYEQLDSIALALVRVFSPWGVRECALLLFDENGILSMQADAPISIERFTLSPDEMVAAREVMIYGKMKEMSQASYEASRREVLRRANGACERCGRARKLVGVTVLSGAKPTLSCEASSLACSLESKPSLPIGWLICYNMAHHDASTACRCKE